MSKTKMEVPYPRPKKPVLAKAGKTIGFQKRYNFILFVIFGGAMLGFTLAKFQYLNYDKIYCNRERTGLSTASPGECYWYDRGFYRIGMLMHLGGTLPAGFLTVFQFIPVIRYTSMVFHRINGYLVLVLFLISNAGMFMFVRHSFGGELETQVASGTLAIMSIGAMSLAYYNVKMLQIDQHRAWMLRGWFYVSGQLPEAPLADDGPGWLHHYGAHHSDHNGRHCWDAEELLHGAPMLPARLHLQDAGSDAAALSGVHLLLQWDEPGADGCRERKDGQHRSGGERSSRYFVRHVHVACSRVARYRRGGIRALLPRRCCARIAAD